jgi:hypothetical protein
MQTWYDGRYGRLLKSCMVLGKYWYRGTLARLDLLLIRIAGTYVMSLRRHKKATDLHSRSLALVKCPSNIRWLFKSSKSLINRPTRAGSNGIGDKGMNVAVPSLTEDDKG